MGSAVHVRRAGWMALAAVCLLACGCLGPEKKHADAVAAATAPVVDEAESAYKTAIEIHEERLQYDAIKQFDSEDPVYNPKNAKPLLTDAQMDVRLTLLKALADYAKSLEAVTGGLETKELDKASKDLGGSLTALSTASAVDVETGLGMVVATDPTEIATSTTIGNTTTTATSTGTQPEPVITPGMQAALSVGINALGQYLEARKVKQELPGLVKQMDGPIDALCALLAAETKILAGQERRDTDFMIDRETLFLRTAKGMDPEARRERIRTLPGFVRRQQAAAEELTELRQSIEKLALTHKALVAAEQGNNPESISQKIADLSAAGGSLGKFYSTLTGQSN